MTAETDRHSAESSNKRGRATVEESSQARGTSDKSQILIQEEPTGPVVPPQTEETSQQNETDQEAEKRQKDGPAQEDEAPRRTLTRTQRSSANLRKSTTNQEKVSLEVQKELGLITEETKKTVEPQLLKQNKLLAEESDEESDKASDDESSEEIKLSLIEGTYDEQRLRELDEQSISSDDLSRLHEEFLANFKFPSMTDIHLDEEMEQMEEVEEEWEEWEELEETTTKKKLTKKAKTLAKDDAKTSSESTESDYQIDEDDGFSDLDSLDFVPEIPAVQPAAQIDEADDIVTQMTKMTEKIISHEEEPEEDILKEQRQLVQGFLKDLIDQLVEAVEYIDPNDLLRNNLDKRKLAKALMALVQPFKFEKLYNERLMQKVVEQHKYSKKFRAINPIPTEIAEKEKFKYVELLRKIDHLKLLERTTKKQLPRLMSAVVMDLQYSEHLNVACIDQLELSIRTTLIRENFVRLPNVIDRLLKRMESLRNEISYVRLKLFTSQHSYGRIEERLEKFEQISEDLTMGEYIGKQLEIQYLSNVFDDRSLDFFKMQSRFHGDEFKLMCIREKSNMLGDSLDLAKKKQEEVVWRHEKLRNRLVRLNAKHQNTKQDIQDIHCKGGLLTKPFLMHDYDETVQIIAKKRARLVRQREIIANLEKRLKKVERS